METLLKPYIEGMTYDDKCYLAININYDINNGNNEEVVFYNPTQDTDLTFENLHQFSESFIEDNFNFFKEHETMEINSVKSTATAMVFSNGTFSGQSIDVYKNINKSDIDRLTLAAHKDLKSLNDNLLEAINDNKEFQRDPNGYHGVNAKDFY